MNLDVLYRRNIFFCTLMVKVIVIIACVKSVQGANILFYFGVSSYSHRTIMWPFIETLAEHHNVSLMSPYHPKSKSHAHPSVHELVPDGIRKAFENFGQDLLEIRSKGQLLDMWHSFPGLGLETCKALLKDPTWKKWVDESTYDLVLIDAVYSECGYGLAAKWKSKTILLKTSTMFPWEYDLYGVPSEETSWVPTSLYGYGTPMAWSTRIRNSLYPIMYDLSYRWDYLPKLDRIFQERFHNDQLPTIQEQIANVSAVFSNTHFSTDYPRAFPPNFIPIGGIVTEKLEKKQLPKEINNFIQSQGTKDFIYVSFGSAVRPSELKPELLQAFIHTFGNSSTHSFIWKFDGARPKELLANTYTSNWLPQRELLAHPKCRAFVTHAGLGGIHEGIYSAIPMIAIPIFVDQDHNAQRLEHIGAGITLEITTITQKDLEQAIHSIVHDPKYKLNMIEVSKAYQDRQNSPLETAIWWTNKILRSSDVELSLLRPVNGHFSNWLVKRQIDIYVPLALLFLLPVFVIFIVFTATILSLRKFFRSSKAVANMNSKHGVTGSTKVKAN